MIENNELYVIRQIFKSLSHGPQIVQIISRKLKHTNERMRFILILLTIMILTVLRSNAFVRPLRASGRSSRAIFSMSDVSYKVSALYFC